MKKFIVLLLFTVFSTISSAHMAHYNNYNKIEMEIFRNGKLIGYSNYFFTRKDDETIIKNQTKFSVKILGLTIFRVEGYGEEKYINDQLISYNSKTFQNDVKKYVNINFVKDENKFQIKGSSYNGEASVQNIIGNWWNHKILDAKKQISPLSGSIKEQIVEFIKEEQILIKNKKYLVEKYKLKSKNDNLPKDKKLNFDIWYNPKNNIIMKIVYQRMGKWEYIVTDFK